MHHRCVSKRQAHVSVQRAQILLRQRGERISVLHLGGLIGRKNARQLVRMCGILNAVSVREALRRFAKVMTIEAMDLLILVRLSN